MAEKVIDYRFKIVYAIGIIMVVFGHTEGGGIPLFGSFFPFYAFHLGLFVFCSGYFFRVGPEDRIGPVILKKVKKLIIPLYLYNLAYGLLVQLLSLAGFTIGEGFTLYNLTLAPILHGHQFAYNLGGWFVIPLFLVEMFGLFARKLFRLSGKKIPELIFFIVTLGLGVLGNYLSCLGYNYGWWLPLVRMLYFIPFFGLGIFYRNVLEPYLKKIPDALFLLALIVIQRILIQCFGRPLSYTAAWCNDFTEGPFMPIVVGFIGIAFWVRLAKVLEPYLGRRKWLNLIADHTYAIMIHQFIGIMLLKAIFGLCSHLFGIFRNFSWPLFQSDLWWYYLVRGNHLTLILYSAAGIVVAVLIGILVRRISGKIFRKTPKKTETA